MSDYPPTPSFGLSFSFTVPGPSSASSRPTIPSSNRHSTVHAQKKPSVQPLAMTSAQVAHHQNSNIPGFNASPTYQAPPAVPRFEQLLSGQIPPPPFPPLPTTSQELPVQVPPFATGPGTNPNHTFPSQHRSGQANNTHGSANTDYLMAPSDKEEGELSDRDIERKSTSSAQETGMVVPQPTRSGTIDHNRVTDTSGAWNHKGLKGKPPVTNSTSADPRKGAYPNKPATSSNRTPSGPRAYDSYPSNRHANMPKGNSHSPLESRRYDQYIPTRRDSGSNYFRRSISPQNLDPERRRTSAEIPTPFHKNATSQGHIKPPTPPNRYGPAAGKPYSEIRNLAKNAVLNLIPLKVEYKDFINEGINEDVIKGLFEELRLRVPIIIPIQQMEESPPRQEPYLQGPQLTASNTGPDISRGIPIMQTSITSHSPSPSQHQASAEKNQTQGSAGDENDPTFLMRKGGPPTSVAAETGAESINGTSAEPKLSRAEVIKQYLAEIEIKKAKMAEESKTEDAPGMDREKGLAVENEKKVKNELIRLRMEALKKSTALKCTGPPSANNVDAEEVNGQSHTPTNDPLSPPETSLAKQQAPAPAAAIGVNVPFTGIPGLFMTSSSAPSNDVSSSSIQDPTPPPQAHGVNRRKRPVAADFEDTPMPTTSSFKRPFGRSRVERPLVIEVSDDETANGDDDTDMDIDDDDGPDSDRQQKPIQSGQGRGAIRDFPPLPDFPNKRRPGMWGSAPVSTMSTPPLSKDSPFSYPNGRGKSSAKEDLKRKYEQIELVRRKIAELEQKKAKPGSSRGQTPGSSTPGRSSQAAKKDQMQKSPERKEAAAAAATAAEIDRLIEDANRQVNADKLELTKTQAADLEKSGQERKAEAEAEVEAEAERQKQLRLAEIESGIPLIDAEVEKSRNRLEELRAETAKWEAAVREGLEGKRKLMEELERLGVKESKAENKAEIQAERSETPQWDNNALVTLIAPGPRCRYQASTDRDRAEERHTHSVAMRKAVSDATEGLSRSETTQEPLDVSNEITSATRTQLITEADLSLHEDFIKPTASANSAPPSGSPDAMDTQQDGREDGEKNVQTEMHTNLLSGQDLGIPQAETVQAASHAPVASVELVTDTSEAADTEMGDDAVDLNGPSIVDSSRAEPTPNNEDKLLATRDETDQEEGKPNDSRESSDESDFYEPPEATHSPFHERTSSSSDQASTSATGPTNQQPTAGIEAQGDMHALPPEQMAVVPVEKPVHKEYFTPYVSPLKQFRAYRYHRNYLKDVPGGFRSLTYSHNIDANKPLCRWEIDGVCNDQGCQDQHFRDMKLNDDMVLVHLGSVNEGHDAEEKAQYTEGLKQIIQNMRTQKVKDFSTVASQITGYRSRFLKDESRVLILDPQNQQRKSPGTQTGGT